MPVLLIYIPKLVSTGMMYMCALTMRVCVRVAACARVFVLVCSYIYADRRCGTREQTGVFCRTQKKWSWKISLSMKSNMCT
jgi:hypothetical protein